MTDDVDDVVQDRTPRELETRERSVRRKGWQRPTVLPTPDTEPGYAFRWVRLSSLGEVDPTNINSKLREGWEPCRADDHPEIEVVGSSAEIERFRDNIVIGGLILCKMPVEYLDERSEYYENQTRGQMESVDNNLMRENDPRMPLYNNRETRVSFGKGSERSN